MKFSEHWQNLRTKLVRIIAESQSILEQPALRKRWLENAGWPVSAVIAILILITLLLAPAIIDTLAGWLTPELRSKGLFGLNRLRANPLRPWVEGLLWLLYGGGALWLTGHIAWRYRPATEQNNSDSEHTQHRASTPHNTHRQNSDTHSEALEERYRVVSELGRGAMGIVYRAEDTRLHRVVALKVLAPQHAHDPELRARFLREAQAVARLNHRGIVQVYDLIDSPNGCRIAMEFVRGPALSDLTNRQPQAISDVLRWGADIADALASAHEQNVIHRDLKPANVLMAELTHPKITDFGLARLTDHIDNHTTQIGTVMGSPAYMSPEQAAGHVVDARSDIYAFGILLYELIAGRPPFTGDSSQVMAAQITRTPDDIREKRADIPEPLALLIMALLRKEPDFRPQNMRQVALQLTALR